MFNFHLRQYIFKQSNGDIWNFFCDIKQNLCYSTLSKRGLWSNPVILHKNVYQFFYADMDEEDVFHLFFQDSDGNIRYSRMDGQSIKTVTVLGSKTPNLYNKQLFLAPFKNSIYFFYVIQHDNAFMLAYQVLSNNKISNPRVIDYVSGSSIPCSIVYDAEQNIYAFYQSYDGKYFQLGYKKLTPSQKYWSEFIPVTKYTGNCEYPHAIIDENGIIHLCYQRRAPKYFELVYQQKAPDRSLWSPEVVVHSSFHSFDNTSLFMDENNVIIYWVREDVIYYNKGMQSGNGWGKPARLNFAAGRQLQCIGFKSGSPADRKANMYHPLILPASLSGGVKLAFPASFSISAPLADNNDLINVSGNDIKKLLADTFSQIRGNIEELKEGLASVRNNLAKMSNAYDDLSKEFSKYSIRLNMLENKLQQAKKASLKVDERQSEYKKEDNGKNKEADHLSRKDKEKDPDNTNGPEPAETSDTIESSGFDF